MRPRTPAAISHHFNNANLFQPHAEGIPARVINKNTLEYTGEGKKVVIEKNPQDGIVTIKFASGQQLELSFEDRKLAVKYNGAAIQNTTASRCEMNLIDSKENNFPIVIKVTGTADHCVFEITKPGNGHLMNIALDRQPSAVPTPIPSPR